MDAATAFVHDSTQDDLVRAVLYSFAMNDYEGNDTITLKGIVSSEIFDGIETEMVNEAVSTVQQAGLIEWDDTKIGAIRLTSVGRTKFLLVRNDFFDDDEVESLRDCLVDLNIRDLLASPEYRSMKKFFIGLAALPGQPCPLTGQWRAQRLANKTAFIRTGELLPVPETDDAGNQVIWHLLRAENTVVGA
ncbi:hypothetical protein [Collimonas sp.]|jgi:hypothetical protein|uniref:hypothetical protein n=1 Tax=Collimonas sp. TaxID=1963772 RepID=UPI002C31D9E1|nr:hypothetical protein [Collimonas sp.]HWW99679.1 hypothetical protein [Collimonas sp.]